MVLMTAEPTKAVEPHLAVHVVDLDVALDGPWTGEVRRRCRS